MPYAMLTFMFGKVVSDNGPRPALGANFNRLFGASIISNVGDGIGLIAYPWLASAVTRNPLLISLVFVVQRLPWLLVSLPAGVITDRQDRRTLMVGANAARAIITAGVALIVLARSDSLVSPGEVASAGDGDLVLYFLVLAASFLLGTAEVGYDTAAQTILPSLVDEASLQRANGRLIGSEQIANSFVGPPIGSLLLAIGFAVPFIVDATSFAVSAALIALLPKRPPVTVEARTSFREELGDGIRWLWRHNVLRTVAIAAGLVNGFNAMQMAIYVLFAQEVLGTNPTEFALLGTSLAVGAMLGGFLGPRISERLGAGPSLTLPALVNAIAMILTGLASWWPVVWVLFAIYVMTTVMFIVVAASLRQAIVPDGLLGRVNSVSRFISWGVLPIGALIGGVVVSLVDLFASRTTALRAPFLIEGALFIVIYLWTRPRLTTQVIEASKRDARH
jgi:MFS family permease